MRAALYTRVSTLEQAEEGYSLAAQLDRLRAFCEAQHWTIAAVYTDEGASAKTLERPELQRLLAEAEARSFDVLLVWRLDRLTRSVADLYALLQRLETYACGFRSATEAFDTTSAIGRLFITMVAALAQWERENLGERTRMGQIQATREGRRSGAPAPVGYRYEQGLLIPDDLLAPVVQKTFVRYAQGAGLGKLLKWLNDPTAPQPAPPSGTWNLSTLRYMLDNPIYIGHIRYGYQSPRGRRGEKSEEALGRHVPLIDLELWTRVQMFRAQAARFPARAGKGKFALSGLLRCEMCGGALTGNTKYDTNKQGPKVRYYYSCTNRKYTGLCHLPLLRADELEQAVLFALSPYRNPMIANPKQTNPIQRDLTRMARERERLLAGRRRWMDAYERGQIEGIDLQERLKSIHDRLMYLDGHIEAQRGHSVRQEKDKELGERIAHLLDAWEAAEPEERSRLLRGILESIHVGPDKTVRLRFRGA